MDRFYISHAVTSKPPIEKGSKCGDLILIRFCYNKLMLDIIVSLALKQFYFKTAPHENNSIVNCFILTYVLVSKNVDGFAHSSANQK